MFRKGTRCVFDNLEPNPRFFLNIQQRRIAIA